MTRLAWGAATDRGRVRAGNEDCHLAQPPVFLVADGMGGHSAGEIASRIAVDTFRTLVGRDDVDPDEIDVLLAAANERILAEAVEPALASMGTTLVGLVLVRVDGDDFWVLVNVGDSRAYRLQDGALVQVTVDHSRVQELVTAELIAPHEAPTHPERHVVTRSLGGVAAPLADYWLFTPEPGERYLLCSDGLTGEVEDDRIAAVLGSGSADQAARALVAAAVAAGGRDNVTAVVVDVLARSGASPDDTDTAPRPGAETVVDGPVVDLEGGPL